MPIDVPPNDAIAASKLNLVLVLDSKKRYPKVFPLASSRRSLGFILIILSEQNNHPEIARAAAENALRERQGLWQNRVLLASQSEALEPIRL